MAATREDFLHFMRLLFIAFLNIAVVAAIYIFSVEYMWTAAFACPCVHRSRASGVDRYHVGPS